MSEKSNPSMLLRYEQVIAALVKYGFEDILAHPPLNRLVPASDQLVPFRRGERFDKYTRYERIRMLCEELGTTFIKFAQIASNRPDILPEELIAELEKLQSNVPPVAWEQIREILAQPQNEAIFKLAEHIEQKPIASASIAQVHRARIIGDKDVVLKIQRPGIQNTIEADIKILKNFAGIIENYFPEFASFQPKELVKMFERTIRKELRFSTEADNLRRFTEQFKDHPHIHIPRLYPEFTSNNILCLEYIDGKKITDKEQIKLSGLTGAELARRGIDLYYEQIFDHGFFHADPHPGNIFLLRNGKICLIDYGMVGSVTERDKMLLADLLLSVYESDQEGLKRALIKFSNLEHLPNESDLEYDIMDFLAAYRSKTIGDIDSDEVIRALNSLFFEYKIKVPSNLLLLLKTLVIIEGVGLQLDPKYNIIENIAPFVKRLLKRKFSPKRLSREGLRTLSEFADLAVNLPGEVQTILKKAGEGKIHIEFEHKGLDSFYEKMEIVSNRLSFTIVLASVILGSSLIVLAKIPPFIYGIPALGFIGFCIAAFLGLRLVISILKHGDF